MSELEDIKEFIPAIERLTKEAELRRKEAEGVGFAASGLIKQAEALEFSIRLLANTD